MATFLAKAQASREARAASLGIPLSELDAHIERDRQADAIEEQRKRQRRVLDGLRDKLTVAVPDDEVDAAFWGRCDDLHAAPLAHAWHHSGCPILVLAGETSQGKSTAALSVCRFYRSVEWLNGVALERLVQPQSFRERDAGERRFDERAALLVLDDLAAGIESQRVAQFVLELVAARRGRRRLIITANATPRALFETYGKRVEQRLKQSAQVHVLGGPSLRKPWGAK